MISRRRIGSSNSRTRTVLLDAAAELMRTEGHDSVTVRRVAAQAGLKRQLVHYYFRSMEELYSAVIRRASERYLEHQDQALRSGNPLRTLWTLFSNPDGIRLEIEFMALGNKFDSVRMMLVEYAQRSRTMQTEAIRRLVDNGKFDDTQTSPEAAVLILRAIARSLVMDTNIGTSHGHAQTLAAVEQYLRRFDVD